MLQWRLAKAVSRIAETVSRTSYGSERRQRRDARQKHRDARQKHASRSEALRSQDDERVYVRLVHDHCMQALPVLGVVCACHDGVVGIYGEARLSA
jgi:hypothetical protein